jgi:hypothetical protein
MQQQRAKAKPSIKDSEPTGYANTTTSELSSVAMFWDLIDKN